MPQIPHANTTKATFDKWARIINMYKLNEKACI